MDQRTRRSPARFLAPLALIAVVVVAASIVSGANKPGGGSVSSNAGSTQATQTTGSTTSAKTGSTPTAAKKQGPRNYIVKLGDSLGSIAGKTGVSLAHLQELNPNVDSTLLTVGQKIRLR
jgi:LysM repeat protein